MNGVEVPPKLLTLRWKLAEIKMAVSLEPVDRFWCFNFWVKALDVYFNPSITAGPSDPYNWRNAAASYRQYWTFGPAVRPSKSDQMCKCSTGPTGPTIWWPLWHCCVYYYQWYELSPNNSVLKIKILWSAKFRLCRETFQEINGIDKITKHVFVTFYDVQYLLW